MIKNQRIHELDEVGTPYIHKPRIISLRKRRAFDGNIIKILLTRTKI